MKSYQDKNGFYHDRECLNGEPSSNNPWIYTAYAKALGLKVPSVEQFSNAFSDSINHFNDDFLIRRLENGTVQPPFSKDEVLGLMYCLPSYAVWSMFEMTNYNISRKHGSGFINALKAMWRLKGEHRNYVWKNKVYDAYPIAYKIPNKMQHAIDKKIYGESKFKNFLAFQFGVFTTLLFSSAGSKNMLWLQMKMINHPLSFLLNPYKTFLEYFGNEHIFVKQLFDRKNL